MCDDDNMCGLFLFSHSSRIAHNLKNPKHTSVSFCSENNKKRKKNVVKKMLHTFCCCKGCIAHIEINIMHFLSQRTIPQKKSITLNILHDTFRFLPVISVFDFQVLTEGKIKKIETKVANVPAFPELHCKLQTPTKKNTKKQKSILKKMLQQITAVQSK